jgi:protein SCO1/2
VRRILVPKPGRVEDDFRGFIESVVGPVSEIHIGGLELPRALLDALRDALGRSIGNLGHATDSDRRLARGMRYFAWIHARASVVPRKQVVLVAIVAIVAAAGGALVSRIATQSPGVPQAAMTAGTLLQPPRPLANVALIDQDGKPFDGSRLKNRWTLLFFGFTNCPDVCPATLTVLAQVEKKLQDLPESQQPQIALVSVDPQRDTPEQLKKYVAFFSPGFLGLTGTSAGIEAFTRATSVPVAIQKLPGGGYTVDHSAAIFLIDPNGAMHALFSTPHDAAKIAADVRRIVTA